MTPTYTENYIDVPMYKDIMDSTPWLNAGAPRMECFMSATPLSYAYDTKEGPREYKSVPFSDEVLQIMNLINNELESDYNVCFLNFYIDEHQHLGWHADDSPEMDGNHPIAVVSFGEPRYIYVKEKSYKGVVPDADKYLLGDGSLFIMPAGYQDEHLHKIPKGGRKMGGRISLTFRRYVS